MRILGYALILLEESEKKKPKANFPQRASLEALLAKEKLSMYPSARSITAAEVPGHHWVRLAPEVEPLLLGLGFCCL